MRRFPVKQLSGLVAAALFACGIAFGVAIAQTPTLLIPSPTGTEIVDVRGTGPQVTSVQLRQLRDGSGYQKVTPLTGVTIQAGNAVSVIQATPAGAIAALTVLTPVTPFDGQRLQIFSTQAITTFNFTASAGQTVNGNLAGALAANGNVEYIFSLSNQTWDRIS
jgi:hypothetical protein